MAWRRERLRVLYLTCHLPFPAHSGGRLRDAELIRQLAEHVDVHLFVVSKTYEQDRAHEAEAVRHCASVSILPASRPVDSDTAPEKVRRHRCPGMRALIAAELAATDFDVVHVEGYYLMQHVPRDCGVPVFLGTQNVEYLLEEQRCLLAAAEPSPSDRRVEETAWSQADACGAVSLDDLLHIKARLPDAVVRWTPDGADHVRREVHVADPLPRLGPGPRVLYLANFGYEPSADAARVLCDRIWPAILSRVPEANLVLTGANPPGWLVAAASRRPGITVTGPVESVGPHLAAADVFLAPLRIGGGVKVKILEALAAGCAVVTTPIGAQGLPDEARAAMVVAEDDQGTIDGTVRLLRSEEQRRSLEAATREAVRSLPGWGQASRLLRDGWLAMLDRVRTKAEDGQLCASAG
ncbi:glycosyltransferase [Saccharothrix luteola]|uniref:glycosyltransferase n=1 Tax=Saccharothrix luteola TaxID=2893018 RepID=UPI001E5232AC|nr:glycosyltransferase [Saccharothrix luteola]MCC8243020.1 glycosyltransferase family 4 protein [Saccharothrix luteola]